MGILKVNNLKKAFGIDELFHDVNFEVRGGDKVGLVGANGAGKTTLMKILRILRFRSTVKIWNGGWKAWNSF